MLIRWADISSFKTHHFSSASPHLNERCECAIKAFILIFPPFIYLLSSLSICSRKCCAWIRAEESQLEVPLSMNTSRILDLYPSTTVVHFVSDNIVYIDVKHSLGFDCLSNLLAICSFSSTFKDQIHIQIEPHFAVIFWSNFLVSPSWCIYLHIISLPILWNETGFVMDNYVHKKKSINSYFLLFW